MFVFVCTVTVVFEYLTGFFVRDEEMEGGVRFVWVKRGVTLCTSNFSFLLFFCLKFWLKGFEV